MMMSMLVRRMTLSDDDDLSMLFCRTVGATVITTGFTFDLVESVRATISTGATTAIH